MLKYRVLPTPPDPATFRREMIAVRTGKVQASFRPPEDTPHEALADGLAALRYVRANATRYGLDPARIKVVGNVGTPPARGVLRHRGWEATRVNLPPLSSAGRTIVAPAEIEVA